MQRKRTRLCLIVSVLAAALLIALAYSAFAAKNGNDSPVGARFVVSGDAL